MKVSIISVVYNNCNTIQHCVDSVINQKYRNIEYIVIDGNSTDGTKAILEKNINNFSYFISEPDNGIYDAINKGINLATGDIVGVLHSDDFYVDSNVISKVVESFQNQDVDSIYADVNFVESKNEGKVVRHYSSKIFSPNRLKIGLMPAHPTFFVKRDIYEKCGLYKTDYRIAADYELLIRFLYKEKISYHYVPEVLIHMRLGGVSTRDFKSTILLNKEVHRACIENGLNTNYFKLMLKYPIKLYEYRKLLTSRFC